MQNRARPKFENRTKHHISLLFLMLVRSELTNAIKNSLRNMIEEVATRNNRQIFEIENCQRHLYAYTLCAHDS